MMRVAALVAALFLVSSLSLVAVASTANYMDRVDSPTYGGSNGSLNWTPSPWFEFDDDGSPSSGRAQAVTSGSCPQGSHCLALYGPGLPKTVALGRAADLSEFESATLSYKLKFAVDEPLSTGQLLVEGWDGVIWKALIVPYPFFSGSIQESISLPSSYVNAGFKVRFKVAGNLTGDVYIDDIEISGEVEGSTTTTTSTTTTSTSSTTSTLPTTTTSLPITTTLPTITTTTLPALLTSSTSTTTTTAGAPSTTTTTEGGSTATSAVGSTSSDGQTGSSGNGSTATTSEGSIATSGQEKSEPTGTPAPEDGLREAAIGIQAAFDGGGFGDLDGPSLEVMGIAIDPNYSMAAEVIQSSWVYLIVLILLIATAIVSGLDRRRLKRAKHTDV